MSLGIVKPRCRFCDCVVSYFGEICSDCSPADPEDGTLAIVNADLRAMNDRMAAEDY